MHVPHLTPWAGAMAGLRLTDMFMATCAVCTYARALWRMVRRGFYATGKDVTGGALAIISVGIFMHGYSAFSLIRKLGGLPSDSMGGTGFFPPYAAYNLALTVLFAGITTRNQMLAGMPPALARRRGKQQYFLIASATAGMMTLGWALVVLHAL